MLRKNRRGESRAVPLLTYWTSQYVLVLALFLLLLAVIAGVWIRINEYNQHYELIQLRAEQLADECGQLLETNIPLDRLLHEWQARRFGPWPSFIQVVDNSGEIYIFTDKGTPPVPEALQEAPPTLQSVLSGRTVRDQVNLDSETWLRVGVPVYRNGRVGGAVYVSSHSRGLMDQIQHLYGMLAIIWITIGLAGWIVIYSLSRRLTSPLGQLAAAAQSVARGEYDPDLPRQVKGYELQQLVLSFSNMAAQLKEMEKLRTSLLAGVSHELRTPVTSIRGMIQAVHSGVVAGSEAEEFLRISLDESKRLQKMVEDLLDFSYLEAGATPMEQGEVVLPDLLEEVIQQLSVLPSFSGIRFEKDFDGGQALLKGDEGRLRQILINLFDNSRKASATLIQVTVMTGKDGLTIDVADNGRGVDPEDRPYVFERFYRGGQGKEKNHGLGLGLTISRFLARAHGGDLMLMETSPSGSSFRLLLPYSAGSS